MAAIPPGAWLGLLGGGQLGRMFCMAAQSLGYRVVVLDPGRRQPRGQRRRPAHRAPTTSIRAASRELAALVRARRRPSSRTCRRRRSSSWRATARVTPAAASVAIAQDRISEKTFLAGPRLRRRAVRGAAQRRRRARASTRRSLPGIVKSARFGYDGKGQVACRTRDEVARGVRARWAAQPCVLEQLRRARLRGVGDRRAQRARRDARRGRWPRTAIATASSTSRSCRRASPPTLAGARARHRHARGRGARLPRRAVRRDVRRRATARCSSTRSRRGRTTAATTRSTPASRRSSSSRRACSPTCRSATRAQHTPAVMVNLLGDLWFDGAGGDAARARLGATCSRIRARSCTCTASASRGAAARWAT